MTDQVVRIIDSSKQSLLKTVQYTAIFLAWTNQSNKDREKFNFFFSLYLKIFHSRRLFRLCHSLIFIPQMIKQLKKVSSEGIVQKILKVIGDFTIALFYACDNVTILMMMLGNKYYRIVRRTSYTILLIGLVLQITCRVIRLRISFSKQANLKNQLEQLTPTQLLQKLDEIDSDRKIIAMQFIKIAGDLLPTMARTNIPEIIVRTKINKGTVGFFGVVAAIFEIILNSQQRSILV